MKWVNKQDTLYSWFARLPSCQLAVCLYMCAGDIYLSFKMNPKRGLRTSNILLCYVFPSSMDANVMGSVVIMMTPC
jgi:hypothetical protein